MVEKRTEKVLGTAVVATQAEQRAVWKRCHPIRQETSHVEAARVLSKCQALKEALANEVSARHPVAKLKGVRAQRLQQKSSERTAAVFPAHLRLASLASEQEVTMTMKREVMNAKHRLIFRASDRWQERAIAVGIAEHQRIPQQASRNVQCAEIEANLRELT
mmetsp:Transcript_35975/g.95484  ORF Transcript_35975/g.95484 Transcript_35975/m.95484 type:complete len:162 (-) Transcript_35975:321-806(-)